MTAMPSPNAALLAGAAAETLPPTMHAARVRRYGGPEQLVIGPIAVPRPGKGEVLVRVHASSINFGDNVVLSGRPLAARPFLGLRGPRQPIFGIDCAGEVAAIGPEVHDLAVGDRVFGEARGACAEYAVAAVDRLARLPDGVGFVDAATLPVAGVTALRAMQRVRPGDAVLVNGASGGVGHFAVQIAVARGARVTGVCSGRNAELVRGLGASAVVDYTVADFTDTAERYDLILDLAGSAPLSAYRRLLTPDGVYLASVGRLSVLLKAALIGLLDRRVKVLTAPVRRPELDALAELLARGAVRPRIERTWSLDEIAAAMAHQRTGRTRGKCAVRVVEHRTEG